MSGTRWELAISGRWSESPYHSGHIAYYVRRIAGGVWLMKSVERNADLDDVTEEDIEEGALNDDQLQALWGRTLYDTLRTHDAIVGSEPDRHELLKG